MLGLPRLDVVALGLGAVDPAARRAAAAGPPGGGRSARPARRPRVPVQAEPPQRVEDDLDVLGRVALGVGVLDAQQHLAAGVAGLEPVEQRGARATDVERAGRRGREADPHETWKGTAPHADRSSRLARRRGGQGGRARGRARLPRHPDLQPEPARVEAARVPGRRGRGVPRRDGRLGGRRAADPRRLPAQLRHRRPGHPREDADLAHRLAAGRATRSARSASSCIRARRRPARSAPAIARAGEVIREALAESDALPAAPGEHRRHRAARSAARSPSCTSSSTPPAATSGSASAWTPATCSRRATRSAPPRAWTQTLDELDAEVGLDRLGSLHFNDSQTPLGSNRDRHANVGEGEIGEDGCAVFLSEPRFEDLPCVLETPGPGKEGPTAEEIALTRSLRERGLRRAAAASRRGGRRRSGTPAPSAAARPRRRGSSSRRGRRTPGPARRPSRGRRRCCCTRRSSARSAP